MLRNINFTFLCNAISFIGEKHEISVVVHIISPLYCKILYLCILKDIQFLSNHPPNLLRLLASIIMTDQIKYYINQL
jgi:hypothetical protein